MTMFDPNFFWVTCFWNDVPNGTKFYEGIQHYSQFPKEKINKREYYDPNNNVKARLTKPVRRCIFLKVDRVRYNHYVQNIFKPTIPYQTSPPIEEIIRLHNRNL